MKRRTFVKRLALGSLVFGQLRLVSACESPARKWVFKRSGIPAEIAHLVRTKQNHAENLRRLFNKKESSSAEESADCPLPITFTKPWKRISSF